jgi:hypothetical protein
LRLYNPPPNPAKIQDPRANNYIKLHGRKSWEVDALSPKVLEGIVRRHIEENIDPEIFQQKQDESEEERGKIKKFIDSFDKPKRGGKKK